MAGREEEFSAPMEPELKSVGSEAIGGCGMKRKAEDTEEAAAVDAVVLGLPGSERKVMIRQDYSSSSSSEEEEVNDDEDPEVIFARIKAKFEAESDEEVTYEDDSDEFDSEEDVEAIYAKIVAKFDARLRESEALYPGVTYGDCFLEEDSNDDARDELSGVVDEAVPA